MIEDHKIEEIENEIREIAEKTNKSFYKYHFINKKVVFLFLQLKIHDLTERLQLYEKWESKVEDRMDEFLSLIFNLYH